MPPFPFPPRAPSWFAGHMATSLRKLPATLANIDLVIEVRDARLPLTSVNPAFERVLRQAWGQSGSGSGLLDRKGKGRAVDYDGEGLVGRGKEKMVVYTKRDLAEGRYEEPLRKAFLEYANTTVMFADTRSDTDAARILKHAVRLARDRGETLTDGLRVMVVGMPNVGKSSLLNALRRVGVQKGKAFATSSLPGLTRKLTGTVKIHQDPLVYVYDSPGVMLPYLGKKEEGSERGVKLALTAGIKEGLLDPDLVAEYLLWYLNERMALEEGWAECDPNRHLPYTTLLPLPPSFPTPTSLTALLEALANRLGLLRKGGEADTDSARDWFVKAFREGKLGRWTLDDLEGMKLGGGESVSGGMREVVEGVAMEMSMLESMAEDASRQLPLGDRAGQQEEEEEDFIDPRRSGVLASSSRTVQQPAQSQGRREAEPESRSEMRPVTGALAELLLDSKSTGSPDRLDVSPSTSHPDPSHSEMGHGAVSSHVGSDPESEFQSEPVSLSESSSDIRMKSEIQADLDNSTETEQETEKEIDTDTDTTPTTPLEARIAATIRTFLLSQSTSQRTADEGKNLSQTQERKRENRKKAEEREEKWRAKGIVTSGAGVRGGGRADWRKVVGMGGYVKGGGARSGRGWGKRKK